LSIYGKYFIFLEIKGRVDGFLTADPYDRKQKRKRTALEMIRDKRRRQNEPRGNKDDGSH
jgi:hypothetical protein